MAKKDNIKPAKIKNWSQNAAKSVRYVSIDLMKSAFPFTAGSAQNVMSTSNDIRKAIIDTKSSSGILSKSLSQTNLGKTAKGYVQDAVDSLKSGNLAMQQDEKDTFDSFGDMDFDFDDLGTTMDADGQTTIIPEAKIAAKQSQEISKAILTGGGNTVSAIRSLNASLSSANMKTTQALAAQITNVSLLGIQQSSRDMAEANSRLASINKNLVSMIEFNNNNVSVSNQAMLSYFDRSLAMLDDLNKAMNLRDEKSKTASTVDFGRSDLDFLSGGFNPAGYGKHVKKNFDNSMVGTMVGMFKTMSEMNMMMGEKPKSLTHRGLETFLPLLVPSSVKKSGKGLDTDLGRMIQNTLFNIGDMKSDYSGGFGPMGFIKRFAGELFGAERTREQHTSMGNFYKDQMSWNGMANRIVTEAIPSYLAHIESSLSGKGIRYYDPRTGRFKTEKKLVREYNEERDFAVQGAVNDTLSNLNKYLENNQIDKNRRTNIQDQVNDLINERVKGNYSTKEYRDKFSSTLSGSLTNPQFEKISLGLEEGLESAMREMENLRKDIESNHDYLAYRQINNNKRNLNQENHKRNIDTFKYAGRDSFSFFGGDLGQEIDFTAHQYIDPKATENGFKFKVTPDFLRKYKEAVRREEDSVVLDRMIEKEVKSQLSSEKKKKFMNRFNIGNKFTEAGNKVSGTIDEVNAGLFKATGGYTKFTPFKDNVAPAESKATTQPTSGNTRPTKKSNKKGMYTSHDEKRASSKLAEGENAEADLNLQTDINAAMKNITGINSKSVLEVDPARLVEEQDRLQKGIGKEGEALMTTTGDNKMNSFMNVMGGVLLSMQNSFNSIFSGVFGKKGVIHKVWDSDWRKKFFAEMKEKLFNEETGVFKNQVKWVKANAKDIGKGTVEELKGGYNKFHDYAMKGFFGDDYENQEFYQKYLSRFRFKKKEAPEVSLTPPTVMNPPQVNPNETPEAILALPGPDTVSMMDAQQNRGKKLAITQDEIAYSNGPKRAPKALGLSSIKKLKNKKTIEFLKKTHPEALERLMHLYTHPEEDISGESESILSKAQDEYQSANKQKQLGTHQIKSFTVNKKPANEPEAPQATFALAITESAENFKERSEEAADTIFGKEEDQKTEKTSFWKKFKAGLPKTLAAGAVGAGIGLLSGGSMGLIGSMFLPGGPIGGAIVGMGLSLASKNTKFMEFIFGKEDEEGKKTGGLISNKLQTSFKKALPFMASGAALGMLKSFAFKTVAGGGTSGLLMNTLLPGGIIGGAVLGMGMSLLKHNETFNDIVFGKKDENGKRKRDYIGKGMQSANAKMMALMPKVKGGAKGLLAGAVTGAVLSNMGVVGAALSLGGPVGMGLAGLGIGILSSTKRFNQYLFGHEELDEDGNPTGKRLGDGILPRLKNLVLVNVLDPIKQQIEDSAVNFAYFAKKNIMYPFRLAFGPILDTLGTLKDDVGSFVKDKFEVVAEGIGNVFKSVFDKITQPFTKILGKIGRGMIKTLETGAKIASLPVTAPLKLLSTVMAPQRTMSQLGFYKSYYDTIKQTNAEDPNAPRTKLGKAASFVKAWRNKDARESAEEAWINDWTINNGNHLDWRSVRGEQKDDKAALKARLKWKPIDKLREKYVREDRGNDTVYWTDAKMKQMRKSLTSKGIDAADIASEADLRKLIYRKDDWKEARADKLKDREAGIGETKDQATAREHTSHYQEDSLNYLDRIYRTMVKMSQNEVDRQLDKKHGKSSTNRKQRLLKRLNKLGVNPKDLGLNEDNVLNVEDITDLDWALYQDSEEHTRGDFTGWYNKNLWRWNAGVKKPTNQVVEEAPEEEETEKPKQKRMTFRESLKATREMLHGNRASKNPVQAEAPAETEFLAPATITPYQYTKEEKSNDALAAEIRQQNELAKEQLDAQHATNEALYPPGKYDRKERTKEVQTNTTKAVSDQDRDAASTTQSEMTSSIKTGMEGALGWFSDKRKKAMGLFSKKKQEDEEGKHAKALGKEAIGAAGTVLDDTAKIAGKGAKTADAAINKGSILGTAKGLLGIGGGILSAGINGLEEFTKILLGTGPLAKIGIIGALGFLLKAPLDKYGPKIFGTAKDFFTETVSPFVKDVAFPAILTGLGYVKDLFVKHIPEVIDGAISFMGQVAGGIGRWFGDKLGIGNGSKPKFGELTDHEAAVITNAGGKYTTIDGKKYRNDNGQSYLYNKDGSIVVDEKGNPVFDTPVRQQTEKSAIGKAAITTGIIGGTRLLKGQSMGLAKGVVRTSRALGALGGGVGGAALGHGVAGTLTGAKAGTVVGKAIVKGGTVAEKAAKKAPGVVKKFAQKFIDCFKSLAENETVGKILTFFGKDKKLMTTASKAVEKGVDDALKAATPALETTAAAKIENGVVKNGAKSASAILPVVGTAIQLGFGLWNGITGWQEASRLFGVHKDEVDWKMKIISSLYKIISGLPWVWLFDLGLEIFSIFGKEDYKQKFATLIYESFSDEDSIENLKINQKNMGLEAEIYSAQTGNTMTAAEYKNMTQKTVSGKIWDSITGKKTTDETQYRQAAMADNRYNSNVTSSTQYGSDGKTSATIYNNNVTNNYFGSSYETLADPNYNPGAGYGPGPSNTTYNNSTNNYYGNGNQKASFYGPGTSVPVYKQGDTKWANQAIGTMPGGSTSTMASGGCGPTALASVASALTKKQVTPSAVANMASSSGYISKGGATEDLFTSGASRLGLSSTRVNPREITSGLAQGKPVILAGRASKTDANNTPFTKAGHVVTATGMDRKGNVSIADPRTGRQKSYPLDVIRRGMTDGWEMKKGPSGYGDPGIIDDFNTDTPPIGYGKIMDRIKKGAGKIKDALIGTDEERATTKKYFADKKAQNAAASSASTRYVQPSSSGAAGQGTYTTNTYNVPSSAAAYDPIAAEKGKQTFTVGGVLVTSAPSTTNYAKEPSIRLSDLNIKVSLLPTTMNLDTAQKICMLNHPDDIVDVINALNPKQFLDLRDYIISNRLWGPEPLDKYYTEQLRQLAEKGTMKKLKTSGTFKTYSIDELVRDSQMPGYKDILNQNFANQVAAPKSKTTSAKAIEPMTFDTKKPAPQKSGITGINQDYGTLPTPKNSLVKYDKLTVGRGAANPFGKDPLLNYIDKEDKKDAKKQEKANYQTIAKSLLNVTPTDRYTKGIPNNRTKLVNKWIANLLAGAKNEAILGADGILMPWDDVPKISELGGFPFYAPDDPRWANLPYKTGTIQTNGHEILSLASMLSAYTHKGVSPDFLVNSALPFIAQQKSSLYSEAKGVDWKNIFDSSKGLQTHPLIKDSKGKALSVTQDKQGSATFASNLRDAIPMLLSGHEYQGSFFGGQGAMTDDAVLDQLGGAVSLYGNDAFAYPLNAFTDPTSITSVAQATLADLIGSAANTKATLDPAYLFKSSDGKNPLSISTDKRKEMDNNLEKAQAAAEKVPLKDKIRNGFNIIADYLKRFTAIGTEWVSSKLTGRDYERQLDDEGNVMTKEMLADQEQGEQNEAILNDALNSGSFVGGDPYYSDGDYVGKYVKRFESGKKGSTECAHVGNDGGMSYGSYQMIWGKDGQGSAPTFWRKYYADKYGMPANYNELVTLWKQAVDADPSGFFKNEHAFIADQYYNQAVPALSNFDPNKHSRAAQESIWSWAVHRGPGGAAKEFNSIGMANPQSAEPAAWINAVYNKRASVMIDKGWPSIAKGRYGSGADSERAELLALGNTAPITPNAQFSADIPKSTPTTDTAITMSYETPKSSVVNTMKTGTASYSDVKRLALNPLTIPFVPAPSLQMLYGTPITESGKSSTHYVDGLPHGGGSRYFGNPVGYGDGDTKALPAAATNSFQDYLTEQRSKSTSGQVNEKNIGSTSMFDNVNMVMNAGIRSKLEGISYEQALNESVEATKVPEANIIDNAISSTATNNATAGYDTGATVDTKNDVANNFPYFRQADSRWGKLPYTSANDPSQTIASSACGPTSMAMVLRSYGIPSDPAQTSKWSVAHGYRTRNTGTSHGFFPKIGAENGLTVQSIGKTAPGISGALKAGDPLIASMGPDTFTKGGHFIVLSGVNSAGNILVNDPASKDRTTKAWPLSTFLQQGKAFWSFSKDGKGSIGRATGNAMNTATSKIPNSNSLEKGSNDFNRDYTTTQLRNMEKQSQLSGYGDPVGYGTGDTNKSANISIDRKKVRDYASRAAKSTSKVNKKADTIDLNISPMNISDSYDDGVSKADVSKTMNLLDTNSTYYGEGAISAPIQGSTDLRQKVQVALNADGVENKLDGILQVLGEFFSFAKEQPKAASSSTFYGTAVNVNNGSKKPTVVMQNASGAGQDLKQVHMRSIHNGIAKRRY